MQLRFLVSLGIQIVPNFVPLWSLVVSVFKYICIDSGGQVFIVRGERFDLIQNPVMSFTVFPEKAVRYVSINELRFIIPIKCVGVSCYVTFLIEIQLCWF